MKLNKLLSPGKIGTLELKNRFVVPPMGTNFATYDGMVTDEMIAYYRARAEGGFGLIIIEVTAIDRKERQSSTKSACGMIPRSPDLSV